MILLHLLAIIAVFLSPVSWSFQWLTGLGVVISFIFYRRFATYAFTLKHNPSVGWEWLDITGVTGDFSGIEILPSTVLTTFLIALHFKTQNHRNKAIIICKDTMPTDQYRQLLVALKVNGIHAKK